jgi:cobalt-zinc-cadmium efflux system outer membrane protein
MVRLFPYALIGLLPGIAQAQAPPPTLTVETAVALAVKQNPRLAAVAHDLSAARAGGRSARALSNPQLTFTPALTPGGSDEELLFQQPLELNGTRSARAGIAGAQLRQTRAEAVTELRRVVFETQTAYLDLLRARELRTVAQDLLRSAEELDRITRRQVEVGTRPGIDRTQTAIEVTRAQQQVTLAESQVTAATGALNTLLGRPPVEAVGGLEPPVFAPLAGEREALVQSALTARTEIDGAEAARESLLQEARLARAQGRPDLAPQLRGGNLTRNTATPGIGLGITLPFLDYGSRRNRIRQAEEGARAQASRGEATRAQVRQEVEAAFTRSQAAETVLASYRQGILEQARRLLDASRTGFESGLTSVVGLLEAQRTYRTVLTEYANALIDHALARVELERALGSVSPDLLPTLPAVSRSPK